MPPTNGMRWGRRPPTPRARRIASTPSWRWMPARSPGQALDPGEMIHVRVLPWSRFMTDLAEGRLEIPGLHLGALWQLRTFARQTKDPRLLALDL